MNFKANESAAKLRGAYYTNPLIAEFLTRWALGRAPVVVLEPSCGDGAFLREIADFGSATLRTVLACELDADEAEKALRVRFAGGTELRLHNGDFIAWALSQARQPPTVDAVVGNPPFIRYQYLAREMQARAEDLFAHLGLPFTKHTNAWVPFVLASLARLRPEGRLAMVVPAELLHVIHAQAVRSHLIATCARVLVVDPSEILFDQTLQGVVLLLAERKAAEGGPAGKVAITKIRSRIDLRSPDDLFASAVYTDGSTLRSKWMPALLSQSERILLDGLESRAIARRFSVAAQVDVGIITGANKFFLVPDDVVAANGLSRFAHPMFGRSDHVRGVIHDKERQKENHRAGLPANFLWFDDVPRSQLPLAVQRYLAKGEAEGLHRRFKCRSRAPWYRVPYVSAAPVVMLKRAHHFHRMILNTAGAYTTDTAYRIRDRLGTKQGAANLVFSFVSSLTALSAELEGRHYGGGVLELVPSEIEQLLVPRTMARNVELHALDADIRAALPAEEVLVRQDARLLRKLGLSASETDQLNVAWQRLRDRRHRTDAVMDADSAPDVERHYRTIRKAGQPISMKKRLLPATG